MASSAVRARAGVGAALLGALLLAACATGESPADAEPTVASTTTSTTTTTTIPEPTVAPTTTTAIPSKPLYYTFEGTWETYSLTGYFCTENDESFLGVQNLSDPGGDPGFAFFRDGKVVVDGTRPTRPGSSHGFGGEGTWDFLIGLDGRPAAIGGTIDAQYAVPGVGPGTIRHFSANLDIDVTPGYTDPNLIAICEHITSQGS